MALLSFLSGKNQSQAFNYASENFNQDNENPYYATTWAFALTIRNRTEDALTIVENLSEEQKNDPQRAVYLAKIFYSAGKKAEAKELLRRVDESALFSEEKFLLIALRESILEDTQ